MYSRPSNTDEELIDMLKKWKNYCSVQSQCHNACRGRFRLINLSMMIPAILLSSVSGIGAIQASSSAFCSERTDWKAFSFGLLAIVSSAVVAIHRYINVTELQKDYDFFSDMFMNLGNEITLHLTLQTSSNRVYVNLSEFAKNIAWKLETLIDKAPAISSSVAARFQTHPRPSREQLRNCLSIPRNVDVEQPNP